MRGTFYDSGEVWMMCAKAALFTITLLAASLVVCAYPSFVHAANGPSQIVWGDRIEDPDTGKYLSSDQIYIEHGETYAVPIGVSKEVYVQVQQIQDGSITPFLEDAYGPLYFIPDPQSGVRQYVETIGGYLGAQELAWEHPGMYELDVYLQPPPILSDRTPMWERVLSVLIGEIAHAQTGDEFVGTIRFTITDENDAPPACTQDCFSNVLFLPGIEASRLYRPRVIGDGEDRLWEPNANSDIEDLFLNAEGESVRDDVYTKERDIFDELPDGENIYTSFIAEMDDLKEQGAISDWEPIAYDWRLSLDDILAYGNDVEGKIYYSGQYRATSTPYIIQELRHLAATSKSGKVTLIAHSNGGLVAKRLTEVLGEEAESLIDKMIFVAVPQAGTPMAIAAGMHGHDQSHVFGLVTNEETARAFAKNSPMEYHLLPSAQYFTQVDDPVVTFDPSLTELVSVYGEVIHSQERLHAFLAGSVGKVDPQTGDTHRPIQFNDPMLSNAETLHDDLDNWTPPSGVELIQIAGWGVPKTVSGITYRKKGDDTTYEPNFTIDGDGTVVVPSALWTSESAGAVNYWLNLRNYSINRPLETLGGFFPFNHGDILEVEPLLSLISDSITENTKALNDYVYFSTEPPPSTQTRLRFALHSPLTLNLYDDQGRHTGMSTTTGQLEEQIPGTYYEEFGDVKYLFVDTSASFRIVMEGTGTGAFTFVVSELQGNNVVASTTFSDIPVTPQTLVSMTISAGLASASDMSVDTDGDGAIDSQYASSTGDLVAPPAEPDSDPAPAPTVGSGGGGGNGPPISLNIQSDVATSTPVVATTTAAPSSEAISTGTIQTATATTTITDATTTAIARPGIAKVTRVVRSASKPIVAVAQKPILPKQSTQTAVAAQSTGGGLWSKIFHWIIEKTSEIFRN